MDNDDMVLNAASLILQRKAKEWRDNEIYAIDNGWHLVAKLCKDNAERYEATFQLLEQCL